MIYRSNSIQKTVLVYNFELQFNKIGINMLGDNSKDTIKITKNSEYVKKMISVSKYSCEGCIYLLITQMKFQIDRKLKVFLVQDFFVY